MASLLIKSILNKPRFVAPSNLVVDEIYIYWLEWDIDHISIVLLS